MAIDMVYDIFKKHNPMLACVTEGHDPRECFAVYSGLDFSGYHGNGKYITRLNEPFYKIGHAAGKNKGSRIPNTHFREMFHRKPKPSLPVRIVNTNESGNVTIRYIQRKPHSEMFR